MFLRFDKKSLNVDVLVGVAEEYKPNESIIAIYDEAQQLREDTGKFLDENFSTRDQKIILEKLSADKELESKWKEFLVNEYGNRAQKIQEKVNGINQQGQIVPE